MEFEKVVFGRRSIRSYTAEPVSDEDLSYILKAGLHAPSGVDLQPWYFVVVRSPEQMRKLVDVMGLVSEKIAPALKNRFSSHPEVAEESLRFIRRLGGAPICILAFWHQPEYPKKEASIIQSISAAIENMLLAAYDRGLGGCWMTAPVGMAAETTLREQFAPGKGPLVAMLTLGHPAAVPEMPARKTGRYTIL